VKAGQDAASAAVLRNHSSGTPRVSGRPYYEGPPSMAARGSDERRGNLPGSGRAKSSPSGPGSTVPRRETAAMERRKASALRHWAHHAARREVKGCADRRSIPSGLPRGKKKTAAPISGLPEIGKFGFPDRLKPIWVRRLKKYGRRSVG